MSPVTVLAVISLIAELVKVSPAVANELRALFAKGEPTDADFEALRRRVAAMTLEEM